jgi:hypothetical protein
MHMTLRKSKPEDRNLPAWLDSLVGPLYLDFVAPMPLEEALRQLKAEEQTGFFRYRRVHVDLIPHDADTFGFRVKKSGGRYATTEARGLLKRWDKHTTQVTGEVNLAAYNYWTMPLAFMFMLVFIAAMPGNMGWFAVVFVGIMALAWVTMRSNRQDVAQIILKALEARSDEPPIRW